MLQYFNRMSKSFAARILFAILLFAFVIFGIGDVLRNRGGSGYVADVGDQHISAEQLESAFEQTIHGKMDAATARKAGLLDNVLNSMIDDALAQMAAKDSGLAVGRSQLLSIIEKSPAFQDEKTHAVDPARFKQFLAAYHLTEPEFIEYLDHQTTLKLLSDAELGAVTPPVTLVSALYAYAKEQRRGHILRLLNAAMTVAQPTQDQLQATFHAHEADFTAPEYRTFSYLELTVPDLSKKVTVTPDDVKQAYDARADQFKVPERRDLTQVLTGDKTKADQVATLAAAGKSLADAAKQAGIIEKPQDMGLMAKADVPDALQEPVFAAAANTILPPIQTGFGWDVVNVRRIEPAHQMTFDQAKAAIETDLRAERARDEIADDSKKLDDKLAGGASLAEAGTMFGITPVTVGPVDAKGLDPSGKEVAEAKSNPEILQTAFSAAKDTPFQVQDGSAGSIFAVSLTDIKPAALRSLDSVRDKVVALWSSDMRKSVAAAKANDLVKKLGDTHLGLGSVAGQAGAVMSAVGPVTRDIHDKSIPHEITAALFSIQHTGGVAIATTADGPVLIQLTDIQPVADVTSGNLAVLSKSVGKQMQEDMASEYEQALRGAYKVRLHEDELSKLRGTE